MSDNPATAMVLAAGLGTRLKPITDERPKALVPVCGKRLIDYTLERLAGAGVEHAVVNVHHFADSMEKHLGLRKDRAPLIQISDEREDVLETGGALVKAKAMLGKKPIFIANIDAIFIPDDDTERGYGRFQRQYNPAKEDARLLLVPKARASGIDGPGDFHVNEDGTIRRPEPGEDAPFYYSGVQIFDPKLLHGWPESKFSLNEIWEKSLEAGRLYGSVFSGEWLHVGDPAGLEAASARLKCAPEPAA